MYKHRILKLRQPAQGHADVTIGEPDEVHAKSIQLKFDHRRPQRRQLDDQGGAEPDLRRARREPPFQ